MREPSSSTRPHQNDAPPAQSSAPSAVAAISTVLTPSERIRVDAAGVGSYNALHRDSVEEVLRDLRGNRSAAVLVSVIRYGQSGRDDVAMMVREFPRVPMVALLSELEPGTPRTVLTLGRSGVQQLVDVREPGGWRELRNLLLATHRDGIQRRALSLLQQDLLGAPDDCWRFFELLFLSPPRVSTVRLLAQQLGVMPSTLMSRFHRAGVPSPKRYLAWSRLVRAARLFENPGFSVANVSDHLDYSSPQSFGRHVRTLLGLTAVEFRYRYDGEGMLELFRQRMILPYLAALRRLTPLTAPVSWLRPRWRR